MITQANYTYPGLRRIFYRGPGWRPMGDRQSVRQQRHHHRSRRAGAKAVICQHLRRPTPLAVDKKMYKWRHLIENFFGKLKEFKRIAMRADKTDQSFAAMIHLAAAVIASK